MNTRVKPTSGKPVLHGFITSRYLVESKEPLMSSLDDKGLTTGQLIDRHIHDHNQEVMERKMEARQDGRTYDGPGFIQSITIDLLPNEELPGG